MLYKALPINFDMGQNSLYICAISLEDINNLGSPQLPFFCWSKPGFPKLDDTDHWWPISNIG